MDLRLCKVNDEIGYFHCWEQFSKPVPADTVRGGAPAGILSLMLGIVEFKDGIGRINPEEIHFCDEKNAMLYNLNKKGE